MKKKKEKKVQQVISDPAIARPFIDIRTYLKDTLWLLEHNYIPSNVSEIFGGLNVTIHWNYMGNNSGSRVRQWPDHLLDFLISRATMISGSAVSGFMIFLMELDGEHLTWDV
jgi:hypothetical protein